MPFVTTEIASAVELEPVPATTGTPAVPSGQNCALVGSGVGCGVGCGVSGALQHPKTRFMSQESAVVWVTVKQQRHAESLVLFDPDHSWDERILTEQFRY